MRMVVIVFSEMVLLSSCTQEIFFEVRGLNENKLMSNNNSGRERTKNRKFSMDLFS